VKSKHLSVHPSCHGLCKQAEDEEGGSSLTIRGPSLDGGSSESRGSARNLASRTIGDPRVSAASFAGNFPELLRIGGRGGAGPGGDGGRERSKSYSGVPGIGEPGFDPHGLTMSASSPASGVGRGFFGDTGDGDRLGTAIGAQGLVPAETTLLRLGIRVGLSSSRMGEGVLEGTVIGDGEPGSGDPQAMDGKRAVASARS